MQTITINLVGTDYEIKELTLGQLEEIQDALFAPAQPSSGINSKVNREIIAIALSADHSQVTRQLIGAMRLGSIRKVDAVVTEILKFGGFNVGGAKSETAQPGEAVASGE